MNLEKALRAAQCPMGLTSVLSGVLGGDFDSIKIINNLKLSISEAEKQLTEIEKGQKNCRSDAAYWGYESQISSLKATINILKAAEITGIENLPDVDLPKTDGVIMDIQHNIRSFANTVLSKAESTKGKIKAGNVAE